MAFLNENKQFRTITEFANYLGTLPKSDWAYGATFHNTYIPNITQWRGSQSMISMQRTYEQKSPPWDRGPHLYIAVGSPNPAWDGIWVMTPPNIPGIHAGPCNGSEDSMSGRWGVELVGDFQLSYPTDRQLDLMTDAIAVLHEWQGIKTAVVNSHRDCMPGRTCPGDAFYLIRDRVVTMVDGRLTSEDLIWNRWGTRYPLPKDQRIFGLPQTWYVNMVDPSKPDLGSATSFPVYSGNNVTQLFTNGMIIYRIGSGRVIMYSEFRVP